MENQQCEKGPTFWPQIAKVYAIEWSYAERRFRVEAPTQEEVFAMAERVGFGKTLAQNGEPILNRPVTELNLSTRAFNILESQKIRTIGQLAATMPRSLLKARSCGQETVREIERELGRFGLMLGCVDVE